jgi:hypothetical protein
MTEPKRTQDTSDKSGREVDRQSPERDPEGQGQRNPEPHRKGGDTGTGREGRQV